MSNWVDYTLDVLASSPAEINRIADRLNQPSLELAAWAARRSGQPVAEVAANLKELLEFKTVQNLGCLNNDVNKARRFSLELKDRYYGIASSHVFEVSKEYPKAVFLLKYSDDMASYAGKRVIRAGELVREVHDSDQQVQGLDWALLDIFAPFRAEYYGEQHEFGSLWQYWVDAIIAAADWAP